ncbi:MAG: hypothetical protein Tsb009_06590 [Planctomycetaceae bacterium]
MGTNTAPPQVNATAGNVGGELALTVFDFSQNLGEIWRGSNFAVRREILNCVSLNRTLGDLSLVLAKRKPFDFLAERPFLKNSREFRRPIELFVASVAEWDATVIQLVLAA